MVAVLQLHCRRASVFRFDIVVDVEDIALADNRFVPDMVAARAVLQKSAEQAIRSIGVDRCWRTESRADSCILSRVCNVGICPVDGVCPTGHA